MPEQQHGGIPPVGCPLSGVARVNAVQLNKSWQVLLLGAASRTPFRTNNGIARKSPRKGKTTLATIVKKATKGTTPTGVAAFVA